MKASSSSSSAVPSPSAALKELRSKPGLLAASAAALCTPLTTLSRTASSSMREVNASADGASLE